MTTKAPAKKAPAKKAAPGKPRGLRAALKQRVSNQTIYRVPIVPLAEAQRLQREVQSAEQVVQAGQYLQSREGGTNQEVVDGIRAAEKTRDKLQRELDACFYEVRFVGLPADEFDALVQMHPPLDADVREAQGKGDEPPLWNDDTFYPQLLEACAVSSELSAEEWATELKSWTRAERKEVQAKALEANVRSYGTALSFV